MKEGKDRTKEGYGAMRKGKRGEDGEEQKEQKARHTEDKRVSREGSGLKISKS